MPRRTKSYRDLVNQYERIRGMVPSTFDNAAESMRNDRRLRIARNAMQAYAGNMNEADRRKGRNPNDTGALDRQFTRMQYMGLSNG